MSTRPLFPMFLKLNGKDCLVVGGAAILESKILSLIASGARIRLVAEDVADVILPLALRKRLTWEKRRFLPADLEEVALVLASDADQTVNDEVFQEASRRNIPCNVVDQPELCSFYYPAVVRRGQLQVAISTGGLSPSLASRLCQELQDRIDPEYGAWVDALGKARERILRTRQASPRRNALLKRIASRRAFERFRSRLHTQGGVA